MFNVSTIAAALLIFIPATVELAFGEPSEPQIRREEDDGTKPDPKSPPPSAPLTSSVPVDQRCAPVPGSVVTSDRELDRLCAEYRWQTARGAE